MLKNATRSSFREEGSRGSFVNAVGFDIRVLSQKVRGQQLALLLLPANGIN
ncbi:MAG: hypothetical protein ABGX22_17795 [Pirellulaceae bacterium]